MEEGTKELPMKVTNKKRKDDQLAISPKKSPWKPTFHPVPPYLLRRSTRVASTAALVSAEEHQLASAKLYFEKTRDGLEEKREEKTLQAIVEYVGDPPFGPALDDAQRFRVNNQKRKAQHGKQACFDILDGCGSSIYAYSLPLAPLACLLQAFKTETSLVQFKKETKVLSSFNLTSYMFLHWDHGVEASQGNYKNHKFVKSRPGLAVAIESLGNFFARRVLLKPELGDKLHPGLLCNNPTIEFAKDCQAPHWDFIGWRKLKAKDMPWVVHIPLCREGMMLHVWPTERDIDSHTEATEKFKLGKPKLVHVGFGDALLLRADVCHGGCFGSTGNMRFHMLLRNQGCALSTEQLHYLENSGVDKERFKEKNMELHNILGKDGTFDSFFRREMRKKSKTVLAYTKALEALYPEADGWCTDLLGPVKF
jgi:hypothetical protein